jgi:hypothetical protein
VVTNPLMPALYDIVWSGFAVVAIAFFVLALVSILRPASLTETARVLWVLVVFFFPIAGPAVWFLFGRRRDTPADA